ncbi:dehydrogenase/reductase SDR family member 7 isoform X2 [Neomonachus schauinslandi]|uniref:Dehydrogenase/reductase SDR family member 7 isoform X2 n=1 Tax=Neomonachus schauinslandi TaxID=29088 RepID=A0A8M1MSN3_NEOSC|nr:dehydrogenase/reductase SDR family member 7 isoform X2 [Neomonachus schauinslandi]
MSWELLLWLLVLCVLLALVVQLLRFLRADGDLTLLWAEWQGRRPEWELTDMVVWVTGASSGIGEELACQLSKLGVSLVLSARRVQELERVKTRCLENGNLKEKDILVLPLDLTDRSSHEAATKVVLQEFGKGFFNCLRAELATYPGIVISNICPGPVQSNIVKNSLFEDVQKTIGVDTAQSHKMATSRCVRLMLISMANDLKEVWISDHPFLLITYFWQYMPTWALWLTNKLGKRRIENFKNGLDADISYFKTWKTKHD